jgi:hypothetical protein
MENNEIKKWRKWEVVVNVLVIAVALLTLAKAAWGLQTQDIAAWASEGSPGIGSDRPQPSSPLGATKYR